MKLKTINDQYVALSYFAEEAKDLKFTLTSATRLKIATSMAKLRNIIELYENERKNLIQSMGTTVDGKDDQFEVKADSPKFADFRKEIEGMLELEYDITTEPLSSDDVFGPKSSSNQVSLALLSDLKRLNLVE